MSDLIKDLQKFESELDEDWAEKDYLQSLDYLIRLSSENVSDAYIIEGLLSVTSAYLDIADINSSPEHVQKYGVGFIS